MKILCKANDVDRLFISKRKCHSDFVTTFWKAVASNLHFVHFGFDMSSQNRHELLKNPAYFLLIDLFKKVTIDELCSFQSSFINTAYDVLDTYIGNKNSKVI